MASSPVEGQHVYLNAEMEAGRYSCTGILPIRRDVHKEFLNMESP
jgi:hypothetical protein